MFERNKQNINMQNKNFGNDEYYLSQIEKLKKEIHRFHDFRPHRWFPGRREGLA